MHTATASKQMNKAMISIQYMIGHKVSSTVFISKSFTSQDQVAVVRDVSLACK